MASGLMLDALTASEKLRDMVPVSRFRDTNDTSSGSIRSGVYKVILRAFPSSLAFSDRPPVSITVSLV